MRLTIYETNRFARLRTTRRFAAGCAFAVAGVLGLISYARGAEVSPTPEAVGHATLMDALAPVIATRSAIATVNVAPLDVRRNLAPCARIAGFLPPGARLVGKTLVGIRCIEGASWQTFLAADVRVEAAVWQSTRALRAGDPLGSVDLVQAQAALTTADIDAAAAIARQGASGTANTITAAPARGLATIDGRMPAPLGRIVQRPVAMGRALAASDLREAGRINPGDAVRVVYSGEGFSISSEGHSVGAADPGANVLIRLASGALVNGTLLADHRVELPR
ncbi:MAG: flagella basal body P-ring formation protein FlgA [Burkholderiaceae bacterium]